MYNKANKNACCAPAKYHGPGSGRYGMMNPFAMMDEMMNGFFREFDHPEAHRPPFERMAGIRTDIIDKEDKYLLEAELPGFDKDDIELDLKNDILTIRASRKSNTEEKDDEKNYIRRERHESLCERSFKIKDIEFDDIDAKYENGILSVTLPKKKELIEKDTVKKIEIK